MIGMPMLVLLLGRARTRDVRRRSIEDLLPAKMSCPSNVNIRRTGRKVLNHLERILPNRTGAFDGDVSSGFRDQRLQAFELAAPDRLHVPITARVPRLGRISNTDGSYLHDVHLRSARKFDPVPWIGRLSENDPTARHDREIGAFVVMHEGFGAHHDPGQMPTSGSTSCTILVKAHQQQPRVK